VISRLLGPLWVRFPLSLWVLSVFSLGSLRVRSGSFLANPEQTQSVRSTFALGLHFVRLGSVGIVHICYVMGKKED
jgi:hypothetical protein